MFAFIMLASNGRSIDVNSQKKRWVEFVKKINSPEECPSIVFLIRNFAIYLA